MQARGTHRADELQGEVEGEEVDDVLHVLRRQRPERRLLLEVRRHHVHAQVLRARPRARARLHVSRPAPPRGGSPPSRGPPRAPGARRTLSGVRNGRRSGCWLPGDASAAAAADVPPRPIANPRRQAGGWARPLQVFLWVGLEEGPWRGARAGVDGAPGPGSAAELPRLPGVPSVSWTWHQQARAPSCTKEEVLAGWSPGHLVRSDRENGSPARSHRREPPPPPARPPAPRGPAPGPYAQLLPERRRQTPLQRVP